MTDDSLMTRQIELEVEMSNLGAERYMRSIRRAQDRGDEGSTPYGQRLIKQAIEPLAVAIQEFITAARAGQVGRRHSSLKYFEMLDPEVAAFIIARQILNTLTPGFQLQHTALLVGTALEDEVRLASFITETDQWRWNQLLKLSTSSHKKHRRAVLVAGAKRGDKTFESWGKVSRVHVGLKAIDLFIKSTGLVELDKDARGLRDTRIFVRATAATLDWVSRKIDACELLTPAYLPCVVAPRPWTSPRDGGYHTEIGPGLTLVKTRNQNYIEELTNLTPHLTQVYRSINAVQETRWRVNTRVLDVMRHVVDAGLTVGNTPPPDAEDIPPRPAHIPERIRKAEMTKAELVDFLRWKQAATAVHDHNASLISRRLMIAKTVHVAERYRDERAFYFVHQVDFRGRIYAVAANGFTPQGNDHARGLMEFADGLPIDSEEAAGWLYIHAANMYGEDKCPLDQRVGWTDDHSDLIIETASDPLGNTWWENADKPWQFLAACFEVAGLLEHGYGYVSRIPVQVDGACNGLQHFSAALRDPIGGAATNLTPSEGPQDIYQLVADVVVEKLEAVSGDDEADPTGFAPLWLEFGVDRRGTKRPVMVLPYGGTLHSCREYVEAWLDEDCDPKTRPDPFGRFNRFKATQFLAKIVWDSIGEVVVAARQAMAWLREVSSIVTKHGVPVSWTSPSGLPVVQPYREMRRRRLKTKIGDVIIKLNMTSETDKVDTRRQRNGVSPNWVHSLDAAHLARTVCIGDELGIKHWGMVHDSYATHAANIELMNQCLRVAFVELYTDSDVLQDFRRQVGEALPGGEDDLPPVPDSGSLQIEDVLESDFFFA
tara:strand:+ start:142 stop:2625 length:2484 start_codon:yes stop_codon:yes gene_type:complete